MQRLPFIAGNWKMNGNRSKIDDLLSGLQRGLADFPKDAVDVAIFPPYPYMNQCANALSDCAINVGAQAVAPYSEGAYTGGVSAEMCRDEGCLLALSGHSERRSVFRVTDEDVATQVTRILEAGMQPVVCVGETLDQRESGDALAVIKKQLAAVLERDENRAHLSRLVIAYEPVWAIGTGKRATPDDIVTVHDFIRSEIEACDKASAESVRIVYGGSVKPDNAADLFGLSNVDGALVGGAALVPEDFLEIVKLCCTYS